MMRVKAIYRRRCCVVLSGGQGQHQQQQPGEGSQLMLTARRVRWSATREWRSLAIRTPSPSARAVRSSVRWHVFRLASLLIHRRSLVTPGTHHSKSAPSTNRRRRRHTACSVRLQSVAIKSLRRRLPPATSQGHAQGRGQDGTARRMDPYIARYCFADTSATRFH